MRPNKVKEIKTVPRKIKKTKRYGYYYRCPLHHRSTARLEDRTLLCYAHFLNLPKGKTIEHAFRLFTEKVELASGGLLIKQLFYNYK